MIVAIVLSDHFRREPYPQTGAACGGEARRRTGAFARAGKKVMVRARTAARSRRRQDKGRCGVVTCGRRPIGERQTKKPAADGSARALDSSCDDGVMPLICLTGQALISIFSKLKSLRLDFSKWTMDRSMQLSIQVSASADRRQSPGADTSQQLRKPIIRFLARWCGPVWKIPDWRLDRMERHRLAADKPDQGRGLLLHLRPNRPA